MMTITSSSPFTGSRVSRRSNCVSRCRCSSEQPAVTSKIATARSNPGAVPERARRAKSLPIRRHLIVAQRPRQRLGEHRALIGQVRQDLPANGLDFVHERLAFRPVTPGGAETLPGGLDAVERPLEVAESRELELLLLLLGDPASSLDPVDLRRQSGFQPGLRFEPHLGRPLLNLRVPSTPRRRSLRLVVIGLLRHENEPLARATTIVVARIARERTM